MSDHFGCKFGLVQRSKGQCAIEKSAYRRGGTARLPDGSVADFSKRTDVVAHFVVTPTGAPTWAADCAQLWTKAVAAEKRANAQEARTVEISIPRSLPREHWVDLARRLARVLAVRGMAVQVDIHCPAASDGGLNPHIHLMATMREIVDGEFSPKKARHWNAYFYNNARAIRRDMAEMLNAFCRMKGVKYHADPRSNAERGLPPAEVNMPRWNILAYKRSGKKTRALEQRDEERKVRAEIARLEAECREAERELAAARAAVALAPAEDIPLVAPPKIVRRPVIKAPAKRSGAETFATQITAPASADFDLPGARYGP
jgi:hypothetical protein